MAEFSVTCRACSMHGMGQECIEDFGEETRRKRPLERPSTRRDNNIQMDLRGQDDDVWAVLVWLRVGISVRLLWRR